MNGNKEEKINTPFVFPEREKVLALQPMAEKILEEKIAEAPARIAVAVKTKRDQITIRKNIAVEKRNISIMEFLDFYDAYKNSIIQLNNLQNARANAIENLNFSVGKDIANK